MILFKFPEKYQVDTYGFDYMFKRFMILSLRFENLTK